MVKKGITLAILSLSLNAHADETDARMKINTLDPRYASPEMKKFADVTVDLGEPSWGIRQSDRNAIFEQSHLLEQMEVAKFDEVDRDVFYHDLRSQEVSVLTVKYSQFPKEQIERAKKLAGEVVVRPSR